MSARARLIVAVGSAMLLLAVLVVAVFFSAPVPVTSAADWSGVWTMRWAAVTALFTALSALAIAATAVYAHDAISEQRRFERVKVARELIRRYEELHIADAVARFSRSRCPSSYSDEEFSADITTVLTFLDECAILRQSNSVEREFLFQFLAIRFVDTWLMLHRVFPRFAQLAHVTTADLESLRTFTLDAQRYVILHEQRDKPLPELLEPLP